MRTSDTFLFEAVMASVAALEEVKDYDDQLKEIIESVSKDISEIANLSGPEKDSV